MSGVPILLRTGATLLTTRNSLSFKTITSFYVSDTLYLLREPTNGTKLSSLFPSWRMDERIKWLHLP